MGIWKETADVGRVSNEEQVDSVGPCLTLISNRKRKEKKLLQVFIKGVI